MAKYKTIQEFFADQSREKLEQINALRAVILETEPKLDEGIKWNAPNYAFLGEDRITFNVLNNQDKVKIVIHMGATRKEDKSGKPVLAKDEGLVDWSSDIRGTISFDNMKDIHKKRQPLRKVLKGWLGVSVN